MTLELQTFFAQMDEVAGQGRRPEPPPPARSSDDPSVPLPPHWIRPQVGSVPFGYVIVGGQDDEKPVRWEHQEWLYDVLHIHDHAVSQAGLVMETMEALFDVLATRQRPPLISVHSLTAALSLGIDQLDPQIVSPIANLLPPGYYMVSLSTVRPRLVEPGTALDYHVTEMSIFWPEDTARAALAAYYRTPGWHEPATITYMSGQQDQGVDVGVNVLLPTQAPEAMNEQRGEHYRQALASGARPTVVTLHEFRYRNSNSQHGGTDLLANLGLSIHHVLDGHHKLHAAAGAGAPVSVLAFTQLPWVAGSHFRSWVQAEQDALARFAEVSAHSPLS